MNNEENEKRIEQIRLILDTRETGDLLEIWENNDSEEWTSEAFTAIQRILLFRLGEVPPQKLRQEPMDISDPAHLTDQALQYLDQAMYYLVSGELAKALINCQTAIQIAPHLAISYYYQGMIFDEMDQLENAIAAYREAVRLDPDLEDARNDLNDAETEYEQTFHIGPAKQHIEQAIAYVYEDDYEKALQECELAIQIAPKSAAIQNSRGMILQELGQLEDAIEAYREAIQLDSNFYAARENLCCARIAWMEEQYRKVSDGIPEVTDEGELIHSGWIYDQMISFDDLEEFDSESTEDNIYNFPAPHMDEKAFILRGWPGHRTRPGYSGYDPLDTDFELAHIEGVLLRYLFTNKFRTNNPIYLIMMGFWGIIFSLPLGFIVLGLFFGELPNPIILIYFFPIGAIGIGLIVNLWNNLLNWDEDSQASITDP